jgi:hypothetical protein
MAQLSVGVPTAMLEEMVAIMEDCVDVHSSILTKVPDMK